MDAKTLEEAIHQMLSMVMDPEINTVSILDLGMLENVLIKKYKDGYSVTIQLLPTFLGCPALGIMKQTILKEMECMEEIKETTVQYLYDPPWTSDRITQKGIEGLKKFGISPPPRMNEEDGSWQVDCPYCGSSFVTVENLFGPTACRSILYCKNCRNPFETMKPISNL
ncbi:1,2-phenylacetyl-CoA epoxidase subunit PaaD [Bacillus sp. 1P06AnD]|uniref:1,2-phenylacetyl-CoA epoxidase subunit PaaD n=1 Tax=Bacillus sp. 1P06AnD TaxID=3132208 RepID=UPI0039A0047E